MPCITLKVFGSPAPHLFLLPSKYLQCGGLVLPSYYCAPEANKEKLNIAFQYLKTKHMDFFLENKYEEEIHVIFAIENCFCRGEREYLEVSPCVVLGV